MRVLPFRRRVARYGNGMEYFQTTSFFGFTSHTSSSVEQQSSVLPLGRRRIWRIVGCGRLFELGTSNRQTTSPLAFTSRTQCCPLSATTVLPFGNRWADSAIWTVGAPSSH